MSTDVIVIATDKIRVVCNESDDDLFAECIKKKCSLNVTDDQEYIDPLSMDFLQGRVISHNSRCYNDGEQNNGPDEKNPLRSYRHLAHSSKARDPFTRTLITKEQFPDFWNEPTPFSVLSFRRLYNPTTLEIMNLYDRTKNNIKSFDKKAFQYFDNVGMINTARDYFERAIQYADYNSDRELHIDIFLMLMNQGIHYLDLGKKYFLSTSALYDNYFDIVAIVSLGKFGMIKEAEELFTRQLEHFPRDEIPTLYVEAEWLRKYGLSDLAQKLESRYARHAS